MKHIRVRMSIKLNGEHTLTQENLNALKPMIEAMIATHLPEGINVDTVQVTRINEAKPTEMEVINEA